MFEDFSMCTLGIVSAYLRITDAVHFGNVELLRVDGDICRCGWGCKGWSHWSRGHLGPDTLAVSIDGANVYGIRDPRDEAGDSVAKLV